MNEVLDKTILEQFKNFNLKADLTRVITVIKRKLFLIQTNNLNQSQIKMLIDHKSKQINSSSHFRMCLFIRRW